MSRLPVSFSLKILGTAAFVILVSVFPLSSRSGTPPVYPPFRPLTNQWTVLIDSTSDSSPAIAPDGTIYFGTWDGKLWALNDDGTRKWVFTAGREIKSSPAIGGDGTVYFGSRDRNFYAVAPDGKKKWSFGADAWIDSSP